VLLNPGIPTHAHYTNLGCCITKFGRHLRYTCSLLSYRHVTLSTRFQTKNPPRLQNLSVARGSDRFMDDLHEFRMGTNDSRRRTIPVALLSQKDNIQYKSSRSPCLQSTLDSGLDEFSERALDQGYTPQLQKAPEPKEKCDADSHLQSVKPLASADVPTISQKIEKRKGIFPISGPRTPNPSKPTCNPLFDLSSQQPNIVAVPARQGAQRAPASTPRYPASRASQEKVIQETAQTKAHSSNSMNDAASQSGQSDYYRRGLSNVG
jgi:hypothetical protein